MWRRALTHIVLREALVSKKPNSKTSGEIHKTHEHHMFSRIGHTLCEHDFPQHRINNTMRLRAQTSDIPQTCGCLISARQLEWPAPPEVSRSARTRRTPELEDTVGHPDTMCYMGLAGAGSFRAVHVAAYAAHGGYCVNRAPTQERATKPQHTPRHTLAAVARTAHITPSCSEIQLAMCFRFCVRMLLVLFRELLFFWRCRLNRAHGPGALFHIGRVVPSTGRVHPCVRMARASVSDGCFRPSVLRQVSGNNVFPQVAMLPNRRWAHVAGSIHPGAYFDGNKHLSAIECSITQT